MSPKCFACSGKGYKTCEKCKGSGELERKSSAEKGKKAGAVACPQCHGSGELTCKVCAGSGRR